MASPRAAPDLPQAFAEAVSLYRQGRLDEAEKIALRLRKSLPASFELRHLLGVIKLGQAQAAAALALIEAALKLKPGAPDALGSRGLALAALGRDAEALACFEEALAVAPDDPDLGSNRGNVLLKLRRPQEALAAFEGVIAAAPGHVGARIGRGNALAALERFEAALWEYEALLAARPASAELHFNRGNALAGLARHAEAIAAYDRALALRPGHLGTSLNRGMALQALNRHEEALACFEQVLARHKGHPDAAHNAALARLTLGDYRRGFAQHEARWQRSGMPPRRRLGKPLWLGEYPLGRKTILLHAEQGLGDAIQFVRYAPLVARAGAQVVLEVPAQLRPLLAAMPGVTRVVARGEPLPPFDLHCPMGSLPLALKTEVSTIPAAIPYLGASEERIARWRPRLADRAGPRVALAWSGRAAHPNDRNRSLALAQLEPLIGLKRPSFVSVQRELRDSDRATLARLPIAALGEELEDFADTAAVLAICDLVISADTSVAHLAGAMGRPAFILLPFQPDWRWMLAREDSPWYPGVRLLRQRTAGDWEGVVARLCGEIERTFG
ncbi:MAG: tetratricopeptide repeat protein [Alphaproteobacteria bacterium]|nr:tetratricopeptide repeat protein [Alphaproteobacteria bacterium]